MAGEIGIRGMKGVAGLPSTPRGTDSPTIWQAASWTGHLAVGGVAENIFDAHFPLPRRALEKGVGTGLVFGQLAGDKSL